jgi:hypothetical protein
LTGIGRQKLESDSEREKVLKEETKESELELTIYKGAD